VIRQRRMLTDADREEISRGIAENREDTVIVARIPPQWVSRLPGRGRPQGSHGASPQTQASQARRRPAIAC
jgi:hypothetical protein